MLRPTPSFYKTQIIGLGKNGAVYFVAGKRKGVIANAGAKKVYTQQHQADEKLGQADNTHYRSLPCFAFFDEDTAQH